MYPTNEERARILRLPTLSRARGCHLYGLDQSRWTDCWRDGGRALLGHRPAGVSLRMKNEMDRGLFSAYPHPWEHRLTRALLKLFPGYSQVRFFRNWERAQKALLLSDRPLDPCFLPQDSPEVDGVLFGRPLLPHHPQASRLIPILPMPGWDGPVPVLFSQNQINLESDPISPVAAAGLTRACGALETLAKKREAKFPIWPHDADIWDVRGPYMMFLGRENQYNALFETMFQRNVLLAPSSRFPSILPETLPRKDAEPLFGTGATE